MHRLISVTERQHIAGVHSKEIMQVSDFDINLHEEIRVCHILPHRNAIVATNELL